MVWKGVLIEESLEDKSLLEEVTQIGYAESFLEEEEDKGVMHFNQFEIPDEKKPWFIAKAMKLLKEGWYAHIGDGKTLVVVFKDKSFEFSLTSRENLEAARRYGRSVGIVEEQMPFEEMINDPLY